MLDHRSPRVSGPSNGDHIEAGRVIQKAVGFQISQRGLCHPPLFAFIDCFRRMASVQRAARFHLDEHDRTTVDGNDIQLAKPRIETASQNAKSFPLQELGGRIFTTIP